jgi:hypothetical protein
MTFAFALQGWTDLGPLLQYGPTVILLVLILAFLLKAMPTWKEIKLKEIDAKVADSKARVAQSSALESVSKVLYEVAIEQRRAADTVKIMQRINSRSADELAEEVQLLREQLEQVKQHDTHISAAA